MLISVARWVQLGALITSVAVIAGCGGTATPEAGADVRPAASPAAPPAAATTAAPEVSVPDLTGKPLADGEKLLADARLTATVTEEKAAGVARDQVIRQTPGVGAKARAGSAVAVVVAFNPPAIESGVKSYGAGFVPGQYTHVADSQRRRFSTTTRRPAPAHSDTSSIDRPTSPSTRSSRLAGSRLDGPPCSVSKEVVSSRRSTTATTLRRAPARSSASTPPATCSRGCRGS